MPRSLRAARRAGRGCCDRARRRAARRGVARAARPRARALAATHALRAARRRSRSWRIGARAAHGARRARGPRGQPAPLVEVVDRRGRIVARSGVAGRRRAARRGPRARDVIASGRAALLGRRGCGGEPLRLYAAPLGEHRRRAGAGGAVAGRGRRPADEQTRPPHPRPRAGAAAVAAALLAIALALAAHPPRAAPAGRLSAARARDRRDGRLRRSASRRPAPRTRSARSPRR